MSNNTNYHVLFFVFHFIGLLTCGLGLFLSIPAHLIYIFVSLGSDDSPSKNEQYNHYKQQQQFSERYESEQQEKQEQLKNKERDQITNCPRCHESVTYTSFGVHTDIIKPCPHCDVSFIFNYKEIARSKAKISKANKTTFISVTVIIGALIVFYAVAIFCTGWMERVN